MVSYRTVVLGLARTRVGTAARDALGTNRVRALSSRVLASRTVVRSPQVLVAAARSRRLDVPDDAAVLTRQGWVHTDPDWQPRDVRAANLALVADALEQAGIDYVLLRTASPGRYSVAVDREERADLVRALTHHPSLRTARVHRVAGDSTDGAAVPVPVLAQTPAIREASVLRVFRLVRSAEGALTVGDAYGCDIELWEQGPGRDLAADMRRAPRPNVASDVLPSATMSATEPVRVGARTYPRPTLFGTPMLEDVTFPIDVVYTWVDGSDPAWRERMLRTRARVEGTTFHPESQGENRFTSRDELRYSLRSLRAYAPWVNHIYLVTDGQVPAWLDPDHPDLTVVDHRDIVADPDVLPLFSSNAIISRLHHIPGLAEHYLYLNDDMFFGHDVREADFFHPSGVARLFPAKLHRPFGSANADDGPHVNISRNIRALLQERFGVTVTRAVRHTPYPQLRSRQLELEQLFPEAYASVLRHPFRHHDDIAADQLLHYYLQVVGAGVTSSIGYDYVNVGLADDLPRLRRLRLERDRAVFCLNDAPEPGRAPMTDAQVTDFLQAYFPVPSDLER